VEDEGFFDDDFIDETAREFMARFGDASVAMLQERGRVADAAGDFLAAQAWRDMAEVAERLLDSIWEPPADLPQVP
jgi:hypothetical protein